MPQPYYTYQQRNQYTPKWKLSPHTSKIHINKPFPLEQCAQTLSQTHKKALMIIFLGFNIQWQQCCTTTKQYTSVKCPIFTTASAFSHLQQPACLLCGQLGGITLPTVSRIAFITQRNSYWPEYVQADPHMMMTIATVMHWLKGLKSLDPAMSEAAQLPENQAAKQSKK